MTTGELLEKYNDQIKEALTDLKTPGRRHKQIPNILTTARLFSPLAIIPTALSGNSEDAMKLAVVFGLTDFVDGFIARKWNLSSPLGADLDALTDKIFAGTLLLTGAVSNPYLLVNTGLEVVIANINLKQKMSDRKSSSTIMGKIKTGAVFTLGGLSVIAATQQDLDKIVLPLAIGTGFLQVLTIASYKKKYDNNNPTSENTSENGELLAKLKEESKFLHQELENIQGKSQETPPKQPETIANYQKIKS